VTPVSTHKAFALGAFRSSVFFIFAIAAFTERDPHTSAILITAVFLIDVASWHLCEVMNITGNLVYNQTWFNTLANRFIFEKILDRFRDRGQIDAAQENPQSIMCLAANGSSGRTVSVRQSI
jgi:hypothetical protein